MSNGILEGWLQIYATPSDQYLISMLKLCRTYETRANPRNVKCYLTAIIYVFHKEGLMLAVPCAINRSLRFVYQGIYPTSFVMWYVFQQVAS